jgi:hypothetical protein
MKPDGTLTGGIAGDWYFRILRKGESHIGRPWNVAFCLPSDDRDLIVITAPNKIQTLPENIAFDISDPRKRFASYGRTEK